MRKKWNENKTAEIKAGLREESAKEGRSQRKKERKKKKKGKEKGRRKGRLRANKKRKSPMIMKVTTSILPLFWVASC